jgi:beta-lactam-binding protein with PASTA domain
MAAVAFYVFNQAAAGGSYVIVPDVTGLPVTTAANVLSEAGLEEGKKQQKQNDRVPEYHVIVQRPRANEVVRAGRKVSLTISAGKETEPAPGFIGKKLTEARTELESTRFIAGSVARIPNPLPADTVLAQDPPPLRPIGIGGEIHLLVSDGPVSKVLYMPVLVGKSLEEAQLALANLNVTVSPFRVDRPGADYDIVLAQSPEPGTQLNEGERVTFDVRTRSTSDLPNARRRAAGQFTVPDLGRPVAVRVEVVDEQGLPHLHYPRPENYTDGRPPLLVANTLVRFSDIEYASELTIRFYVDGTLHTTYYYEGDVSQPLVTTAGGAPPPPPSDTIVHMEELEPDEPANAAPPPNPSTPRP